MKKKVNIYKKKLEKGRNQNKTKGIFKNLLRKKILELIRINKMKEKQCFRLYLRVLWGMLRLLLKIRIRIILFIITGMNKIKKFISQNKWFLGNFKIQKNCSKILEKLKIQLMKICYKMI